MEEMASFMFEMENEESAEVGKGKCYWVLCAYCEINNVYTATLRTLTKRYDSDVSYTPTVSLDLCRSASTKYRPSARNAQPVPSELDENM